MIDKSWIEEMIRLATANSEKENSLQSQKYEYPLIQCLINKCKKNDAQYPYGIQLAACYDLLVAADYYSNISHTGWFYCPDTPQKAFLHFTNCCPRHALQNLFYFNRSAKPGSGSIGKSTSRLLRAFLTELFRTNNREEQILKGSEPVDVIVLNQASKKVFFGEIKASPLVTLPVAMDCDELYDGQEKMQHRELAVINKLSDTELYLFLPKEGGKFLTEAYYSLGKKGQEDKYWGYNAIFQLLENSPSFYEHYLAFWNTCLAYYHPRHTENVFWLTNSCGSPNPKPGDWPKAKGGEGTGYESISDSKTSVGMDRTDDIKKGIYQVLKLGLEGKIIKSDWHFTVGILSNIHAARHFEEYLKSLQNLVWTIDASGTAQTVQDLDDDLPIYSLFDGIISLTQSHFRDAWIKNIFTW